VKIILHDLQLLSRNLGVEHRTPIPAKDPSDIVGNALSLHLHQPAARDGCEPPGQGRLVRPAPPARGHYPRATEEGQLTLTVRLAGGAVAILKARFEAPKAARGPARVAQRRGCESL